MKFDSPLILGTIHKRYKRFLADVELENGEMITAHTANTGSMKSCWQPGWKVALSYHDNPKRKLKYSLEMTFNGESWIGINTSLPNKLAANSITRGEITELHGYEVLKPEVKIGKSRIDLKLSQHPQKPDCFVEIKNVTLRGENNLALFPDAISERGQKHLKELIAIKNQGLRACMLYIVQRNDVDRFSPATEIDPVYAELLKEAYHKGVEILCYQYKVDLTGIALQRALEVGL